LLERFVDVGVIVAWSTWSVVDAETDDVLLGPFVTVARNSADWTDAETGNHIFFFKVFYFFRTEN
jgi:hypothetical protein